MRAHDSGNLKILVKPSIRVLLMSKSSSVEHAAKTTTFTFSHFVSSMKGLNEVGN